MFLSTENRIEEIEQDIEEMRMEAQDSTASVSSIKEIIEKCKSD